MGGGWNFVVKLLYKRSVSPLDISSPISRFVMSFSTLRRAAFFGLEYLGPPGASSIAFCTPPRRYFLTADGLFSSSVGTPPLSAGRSLCSLFMICWADVFVPDCSSCRSCSWIVGSCRMAETSFMIWYFG